MMTLNAGQDRPDSGRFKEAALRRFHDAEDFLSGVADSMKDFIEEAGREALEAGDRLVEITAGVLDAVVEIGHDAAGSARGIALGVLRGKQSDPDSVLTTLAVTSRSVIRYVGRAGGDIAAAARGLVAGAADGARETGLAVSEAVFAVSRGALQGARGFGAGAEKAVHEAVAAMRELTRDRDPGTSHFDEMEDTPMFFPGPMVE